MNPTIYILLPVHNRREITRRFIECLKVQTYQRFHLILIDDGSTDGTAEMIKENICSLTIITGKGDWWWAGALQQGYNWLKKQNIPITDLALIINDDTEFETNFLQNAIESMLNHEHTLLQAQCYSRKTRLLIDGGIHVDWQRLSYEQAVVAAQINCLSTRGLFLRVGDFFEIGGFHPKFLPHYGSDYEFTMRAYRKGMTLLTDTMLKLWFDEDATGFHILASESFFSSIFKIFSKRSPLNPLYGTAYIILTSPWQWIPLNIVRIWLMASCALFSSRSKI